LGGEGKYSAPKLKSISTLKEFHMTEKPTYEELEKKSGFRAGRI